MCRELKREPAWVAAIKLALTQGSVDVEAVIAEANLLPGRERTVRDVLNTMAERDVLREAADHEETGTYLPGPVLYRSAPAPAAAKHLSESGAHRWRRPAD